MVVLKFITCAKSSTRAWRWSRNVSALVPVLLSCVAIIRFNSLIVVSNPFALSTSLLT